MSDTPRTDAIGVITADTINTLSELENAYQRAIRGRHISEIAPILALRNKALEALKSASKEGK